MVKDLRGALLNYYLCNTRNEIKDEANELLPSELNVLTKAGLEVARDKLSVRYEGEGLHGNDVGSIRANHPVPKNRLIYYFEITVLNTGISKKIGIGFTGSCYNPGRQPGWDANTYGYHGDDGCKFSGNSARGEQFGPEFEVNDVVGAGVHLGRNEIFFTHNGNNLGVAFKGVTHTLYPMIGLHSHGEEVEVNFGQKPFQFDVEEIRTEDRAQRDAEISKVKVEPGVCHSLVRDFLIHFGYGRTLSVFDSLAGQSQDSSACRPKPQPGCDTGEATSGSEQPMAIDFEGDAAESDERCSSMAARMSIRGLILSGEIEAAVDLLRKNHPKFFGPAHQDMLFLLYCQSFIEKIRQRQLDKAMNFAHLYLSPMRGRCEMQDSILSEVFALIAYADPEQSPLSYLMTMQHREIVADAINAAMICDLPERREPSDTMPRPVIELLLKQLAAVHLAIRDSNGQGEALDLRELVMRPPGSQD